MKITKRQLHRILLEYHPRPDDDYDPLNPEDDDEDDAAYDQGYDDGFNGYPSEPVIGGDYHVGYEEGVNAAKDEASREEDPEEFGPHSPGMMGPPRREGKIRLTKRQLGRIIREEAEGLLDVESPYDVEPVEDVWGGDPEGEGGNLVLPIDHSKAAKSYPVTAEPEVLPTAGPVLGQESFNRMRVYRGQKDLGRTHRVAPIVLELYYDAMVSGDLTAAAHILEEHLDQRFPGWKDYEWIA